MQTATRRPQSHRLRHSTKIGRSGSCRPSLPCPAPASPHLGVLLLYHLCILFGRLINVKKVRKFGRVALAHKHALPWSVLEPSSDMIITTAQSYERSAAASRHASSPFVSTWPSACFASKRATSSETNVVAPAPAGSGCASSKAACSRRIVFLAATNSARKPSLVARSASNSERSNSTARRSDGLLDAEEAEAPVAGVAHDRLVCCHDGRPSPHPASNGGVAPLRREREDACDR